MQDDVGLVSASEKLQYHISLTETMLYSSTCSRESGMMLQDVRLIPLAKCKFLIPLQDLIAMVQVVQKV